MGQVVGRLIDAWGFVDWSKRLERGASMKKSTGAKRIARLGKALTILSAVLLGGCASLRGSTESVMGSTYDGLKKGNYSTYEKIIDGYEDAGAGKKEYRNRVLALYMDAIDESYDRYSKQLFSEGIQSGLAFDTGILSMSAMAALFKNSADEMATLISTASGVHAAIDKNLYFERTLPALIATMDASRIKVSSEIAAKMALPADAYPIEGAMRDLRRYQEAGTIFRAVTSITGTASEKKSEAEEQAKALQVAFGCEPTDALRAAARPIQFTNLTNQQILEDPDSTEAEKSKAARSISAMAAIMNVELNQKIDPALEPVEMGDAIADALDNPTEKFCNSTDVERLRSKLSAYLIKEK